MMLRIFKKAKEYGSSGYTAPYTGNGFTASERFLIPEYEIPKGNPVEISEGNIYSLDKFGNRKLYAQFNTEKEKFEVVLK